MRPAARLVALALLLLLAAGVPRRASAADDPVALLARLVDLPDPAAREKGAKDLAQRPDVSLEGWQKAIRALPPASSFEAGVQVVDVPLAPKGAQPRVAHTVVYVPSLPERGKPAPLLLALHGTGGRGADMIPWWRPTADALHMFVVAPTEAGAGEEGYHFSEQERADAIEVLRWALGHLPVDPNRVHVTGMSRGGHLAWDLALRHPDRFASLVPMVGGPRLRIEEGQNNLRYMENVAHLPIRDLQGKEDDPLLVFDLQLGFEALKKVGAEDASLLLQEGEAHAFHFDAVDWKAFLGQAVRDPTPDHVVRLAARPGEGRAFWVDVLATKGKVTETFAITVTAAHWNRLNDAEKRREVEKQAEERTARVEAKHLPDGRFDVRTHGVKKLRLLLPAAWIPEDGTVEVSLDGRRIRRSVAPSKEVLLEAFARDLDRGLLPVAEVTLP